MNKACKELMKKNNEREKEISEENDETYTNMIVYLRCADMTQYNQELVREDIIEMILDGQQRGDNIEQVMGNRYQEICDEIIDAMPKRTGKEKIISGLTLSLTCLWILGAAFVGTQFLTALLTGASFMNVTITIGQIVSGALIILAANLIVVYVCKTAFKEQKRNKVITFFKNWGILFLVFSVIIFSNVFLNTPIIAVPVAAAIVFVCAVFGLDRILSAVV